MVTLESSHFGDGFIGFEDGKVAFGEPYYFKMVTLGDPDEDGNPVVFFYDPITEKFLSFSHDEHRLEIDGFIGENAKFSMTD